MYLRKTRPRTTCLYSAESMWPRSLSAAFQRTCSNPRRAPLLLAFTSFGFLPLAICRRAPFPLVTRRRTHVDAGLPASLQDHRFDHVGDGSMFFFCDITKGIFQHG